jgi:S1-C subfamily serine protease
VLALWPPLARPSGAEDAEAMVARLRRAVVAVEDGRGARGTAFFVREDGVLVTAWHVVAGVSRASIRLQQELDGFPYLEVVGTLGADPEKDVVLLKVAGRGFPTIALGDPGTLVPGEPLRLIGLTRGTEETVSRGSFTALRQWPRLGQVLEIEAVVVGGNSGGPVLNGRGEAVGVTAQSFFGERIGLAASIDGVKALLAAATSPVPLGGGPKPVRRSPGDDLARSLEAVRLNPDYPHAYAILGVAYRRLGRHREAVEAFEEALRLKPDLARARFGLAWTHLLAGDRQQAQDALEPLERLDPEAARALRVLLRQASGVPGPK